MSDNQSLDDGGVEHDSAMDVYRVECDQDERPSDVLIQTVAILCQEEAIELDSLYESIDPDALDRLFDYQGIARNGNRSCSFRFNDFFVTVTGEGVIELSPIESG